MWKVTRQDDDKSWEVDDYKYLVFENGRGKRLQNRPKIGTSLMLPPFSPSYLWLTSPITEIIDERHFKTENSEYKIEEI